METQTYTVKNDTNQVYIIYEVGRFNPGETEIELTDEQVQLMEDNAILKLSKVKTSKKSTSKDEDKAPEPVEVSEDNDKNK